MFIKRWVAPCLTVLCLSGFSWGAQECRIEPGWSHIEFAVKNFGIHTVEGRFKNFNGTIAYDETDITRSTVSVTIQTASIDTDIKKRDEHLQTSEFFETAKFPEMTFHSEHITKSIGGYVLTGSLTIKGHTKIVDLPFTYSTDKSPDGKTVVLHAQAGGDIDRHDFGINYGSNFSVGKDIKIIIHIQALP